MKSDAQPIIPADRLHVSHDATCRRNRSDTASSCTLPVARSRGRRWSGTACYPITPLIPPASTAGAAPNAGIPTHSPTRNHHGSASRGQCLPIPQRHDAIASCKKGAAPKPLRKHSDAPAASNGVKDGGTETRLAPCSAGHSQPRRARRLQRRPPHTRPTDLGLAGRGQRPWNSPRAKRTSC